MVRGAPCGATWDAAAGVVGMSPDEAVVRIGLEVQFFCTADPSAWDPICGKSAVHIAGRLHSGALDRAVNILFKTPNHREGKTRAEGELKR